MERKILYEIQSLYRDSFRVTGLIFGHGEPSVCVVGSMRGNENQQLYSCSQLVRMLTEHEGKGRLANGKQVMVIPCVNPYSINVKKRFWSIDNTDINRMFPGYNLGETTQRIAAGVFEAIKDYKYGIQFASFYMPGSFIPHIRIMKTGYENVELAKRFGLPYIVLHTPRPFDTTTLNYNWQLWDTDAFSVYTTNTARIDKGSARQAVNAILNFMAHQDLIHYRNHNGYISRVIESESFVPVRAEASGFFDSRVRTGEEVTEGQLLATISDPYLGTIISKLHAPVYGTVAFVQDEPMTYQHTAVIKLIQEE